MEQEKTKYEIRKDGETKCCFDDPGVYIPEQLRRMEADGHLLYIDGKRTPVRKNLFPIGE